jgi:mono/diheme cytochrome c family protein
VPTAAFGADGDAVARGAYLAGAAGCDTCHTDAEHHGASYAGGRVLATAFGTIATPNLTPDPTTGIGAWSTADFTRALRSGIAPDDTHYVSAFPFPFYNRLTDQDLADLKAFLDSLRPASVANAGAGPLALWARARAAVDVAAAPLPGPWQPDAGRSPELNRGAYLVASIGRCGDCHTPRNWFGVPDAARPLAGGAGPDGKRAPNITPDRSTGIGKWSDNDIVALLATGQTPEFDFVGGAMAEIVKNTSRLTAPDQHAIAVFLQSVPAVATPERK